MEGEKGKRASASDNPEGLNLQMNLSFSFTEVSENGNFITSRNKTALHQSKEGKESGHLSCVCFTVSPDE